MGLFSWMRGKPAPKKAMPAAPAKSGGRAREELIRKAVQIHAEKRRDFDKLDPGLRDTLRRQAMGQAMGKKNPDDGTNA